MTHSGAKYGLISSASDLVAMFVRCRRLETDEAFYYALEQGRVPMAWIMAHAANLHLSLYVVPRRARKVKKPYGLVVSQGAFGEILQHHRNIQEASIADVVDISSLSAETLINIEQGCGYLDDTLKILYTYGLELLIYLEQDSPGEIFNRYKGGIS